MRGYSDVFYTAAQFCLCNETFLCLGMHFRSPRLHLLCRYCSKRSRGRKEQFWIFYKLQFGFEKYFVIQMLCLYVLSESAHCTHWQGLNVSLFHHFGLMLLVVIELLLINAPHHDHHPTASPLYLLFAQKIVHMTLSERLSSKIAVCLWTHSNYDPSNELFSQYDDYPARDLGSRQFDIPTRVSKFAPGCLSYLPTVVIIIRALRGKRSHCASQLYQLCYKVLIIWYMYLTMQWTTFSNHRKALHVKQSKTID